MTQKPKPKRKRASSDCTIPPPIPASALPILVLPRDNDAVREISEYVERQAKSETVAHAGKVSEEYVLGQKHECWDVHTDKSQYWVITEPTNLCEKTLFPSLDYTPVSHWPNCPHDVPA